MNPSEYDCTCFGIPNGFHHLVLQKAVNTITDQGKGRIVLSEGTFTCNEPICIRDVDITIEGQGPGVTKLVFTNSDGIRFENSTNQTEYNFNICNLSLLAAGNIHDNFSALILDGASGDTAEDGYSFPKRQFSVNNLVIEPQALQPGNPGFAYWDNGILLFDAWNSTLSQIRINGDSRQLSGNGIYLSGRSIDVNLENLDIYFVNKAIFVEGECEGIRIFNPVIVKANYGLHWNPPGIEPDLQIHGGHICTKKYGVIASNCYCGYIDGTLFFQRDDVTADDDYVAILVDANSAYFRINGTRVKGCSASQCPNWITGDEDYRRNGIVVKGDYSTIIGNSIENQDTPIWIQSSAEFCSIVGNVGKNNINNVLNSGTSCEEGLNTFN